jgi:alkylation response protein AidB-like acyl-CoA dehydrogenase
MVDDAAVVARTEAFVRERDYLAGDQIAFRGAQFDAGLGLVHFPEGLGGMGGSRSQQALVDEVLRRHGIAYEDLRINPIGIGMAAPTVLVYGSEEMRRRLLRPIFTGEEIWCQLFSEPTNGSDVAGIATRAVRDGDEWVVSGQKVWTTLAHVSRFGLMLARTDPDVVKHRGLSYFVLDMTAQGVEVRPLFQITGEAEFNEVFLTDVRVPDADRLGAEGEGWRVATTTLMNERVALSGGPTPRGAGAIGELLDVWQQVRGALSEAERRVKRDAVVELWVRAEVVRLTNIRAKQLETGGSPGPEGSVGKLAAAELHKRIYCTANDLRGAAGMLHEPGYPMVRSSGPAASTSGRFLRSRAHTIEGGTSEIMRNILGERVLGLPPDVRVDKDLPWSKVPR